MAAYHDRSLRTRDVILALLAAVGVILAIIGVLHSFTLRSFSIWVRSRLMTDGTNTIKSYNSRITQGRLTPMARDPPRLKQSLRWISIGKYKSTLRLAQPALCFYVRPIDSLRTPTSHWCLLLWYSPRNRGVLHSPHKVSNKEVQTLNGRGALLALQRNEARNLFGAHRLPSAPCSRALLYQPSKHLSHSTIHSNKIEEYWVLCVTES